MSLVWIDASRGASGDMLLGALLDAGVPLDVLRHAVDAVAPEPVELVPVPVTRNGFAATRCEVRIGDSAHRRTWSDIRDLLAAAPLERAVADVATSVFARLAEAEAAVHGTTPDAVHFHEVGALDAIADVVGVCAGFVQLDAAEVVVSPVAVGSGTVRGAHGSMPVPPPAVAALLRGVPSYAGPPGAPAVELCTPTGAALLTTLATAYGPQPAMVSSAVGVGAGGRDPEGYANVLRVMVGVSTGSTAGSVSGRVVSTSSTGDVGSTDDLVSTSSTDDMGSTDDVVSTSSTGGSVSTDELVIEANVDDLDPRLWPGVIDALLAAGAVDAWLSPITMKKGRPAYTLHALVPPAAADAVRRAIFTETSTIGLREYAVTKRALERELVTVAVGGAQIAMKAARLEGSVVNAQPEWEDVARAAAALGRPAHDVLAAAQAAAHGLRS